MSLTALPSRASRPTPRGDHGRRVVAAGDPLRSLDEVGESIPEMGGDQRRRERDAQRGADDRERDRTGAIVEERRKRLWGSDEQDPDSGSNSQRQDPVEARHPSRLVAARRSIGPERWYPGLGPVVPPRRRAYFRRLTEPAAAILRPSSEQSGSTPRIRRSTIARQGRIGRPVRRSGDQPAAIRRASAGPGGRGLPGSLAIRSGAFSFGAAMVVRRRCQARALAHVRQRTLAHVLDGALRPRWPAPRMAGAL